MEKKYLGLIAIGLVLLTPIIVSLSSGGSRKDTVSVAKVTPRVLRSSILASGNVVYQDQVQLSPEIIGKVTAVLVEEGDQVAAGQLVMTIEDGAYRSDIAQRESVVRMQRLSIDKRQLDSDELKRKYERASQLMDRGFVTKSDFESKKYEYESSVIDIEADRESLRQAETALAQAKIQLAKTIIRAPVAGTVVAISIKPGETAVPSSVGIAGSSLMTVAQTNSLIAELKVDEADVASVQIGQTVEIQTASFPNRSIQGEVQKISLSPRQNSMAAAVGTSGAAPRSYLVKVSLDVTNDIPLRSGMTCRAEIFYGKDRPVLSVPIQAILPLNSNENTESVNNSKGMVFLFRDGVVVRRVITIGDADDENQQVMDGLKNGELIITGPANTLRNLTEGDKVNLAGSS
jgi:HlyD family secretion protein